MPDPRRCTPAVADTFDVSRPKPETQPCAIGERPATGRCTGGSSTSPGPDCTSEQVGRTARRNVRSRTTMPDSLDESYWRCAAGPKEVRLNSLGGGGAKKAQDMKLRGTPKPSCGGTIRGRWWFVWFVRLGCLTGAFASSCSGIFIVEAGRSDAGSADSAIEAKEAAVDAGSVDAGSVDGRGAVPSFVDPFDRANGSIGNGWLEKSPGVMAIRDGRLRVEGTPADYRRSIVFRPESENIADVEISVDIVAPAWKHMFPQIHARVQTATVLAPDVVDSYLLYMEEDTNKVHIARNRGSNGAVIKKTILVPLALPATQSFRLRLRVTGRAPVKVEGFVERVVDESTVITLGQETFEDSEADRIQTPGSVGLSTFSASDAGSGYTYDNFVRIPQ